MQFKHSMIVFDPLHDRANTVNPSIVDTQLPSKAKQINHIFGVGGRKLGI